MVNGLNDWENGWSITWNILFIDSICMCKLLHSVRKLTVTMGYTKMCTSYSGFMLKLWLASPDLAVIWQVKWQPVRNVSSMKNRVKINYTWKLNINILFAMHHILNVKLQMLDNFNSWSDKHFLILILLNLIVILIVLSLFPKHMRKH